MTPQEIEAALGKKSQAEINELAQRVYPGPVRNWSVEGIVAQFVVWYPRDEFTWCHLLNLKTEVQKLLDASQASAIAAEKTRHWTKVTAVAAWFSAAAAVAATIVAVALWLRH